MKRTINSVKGHLEYINEQLDDLYEHVDDLIEAKYQLAEEAYAINNALEMLVNLLIKKKVISIHEMIQE